MSIKSARLDKRAFVTSIAQAILTGWGRRYGTRRGRLWNRSGGDAYSAYLRAIDIMHKLPGLFLTGTIRIGDA